MINAQKRRRKRQVRQKRKVIILELKKKKHLKAKRWDFLARTKSGWRRLKKYHEPESHYQRGREKFIYK